jgi:hypothetical protein
MNQQKTPLARTLSRTIHGHVNDAFQKSGQALPCSVVSVDGAIVTVKFEINSSFTLPNVTIPLAGAEYIRYPIQPGDKGYVIPADARLAGMSGIGGGVSDLSQPANLTALVFFPFGNAKWSTVDTQAVVIYGPNGVVIRDAGNESNITLTPSGIVITTSGDVTANVTGSVAVTAGSTFNVDASGIGLKGGSGAKLGVVQGSCVCAFTGAPHPQISATVTATI